MSAPAIVGRMKGPEITDLVVVCSWCGLYAEPDGEARHEAGATPTHTICPDCRVGVLREAGLDPEACPDCEGMGHETYKSGVTEACVVCEGTGKRPKDYQPILASDAAEDIAKGAA